MRRCVRAMLLATTAALLLASPALAARQPAHARPRPQIQGRPGAWVIPSQNILTGVITATHGQVRVELTLSAPPAFGVRTVYAVIMYAGCVPYVLDYYWNGTAGLSRAQLNVYRCGTLGLPPERPQQTYPATAAPRGSGVVLRAPYAGVLRPGLRTFAAGVAATPPVVILVGTSASSKVIGGDVAYGTGVFTLGG